MFFCNSWFELDFIYIYTLQIKFGEPGAYLDTGVRNKRVPVEANTTLVAHDHDVQNKGSLTPSVILDVDMSNGLDGSFYHGQVTTILKDAIYERSTNFRTVLELQQYLLQVVYLFLFKFILRYY